MGTMIDDAEFSGTAYEQAAAKYRPTKTSLLFVAEAPPSSLDRYFYFENVRGQDSLWVELLKELFGEGNWRSAKYERMRKRDWLLRFQQNGYQLIDAVKVPTVGTPRARVKRIRECSRELVSEVEKIKPRYLPLIKGTVYDALFRELKDANLPVVDSRLPFPGSGQQKEFHRNFPREILNSLT